MRATASRSWRRRRSAPGAGYTRSAAASGIRPADARLLPESRQQRLELPDRQLLASLGGQAPLPELVGHPLVLASLNLVLGAETRQRVGGLGVGRVQRRQRLETLVELASPGVVSDLQLGQTLRQLAAPLTLFDELPPEILMILQQPPVLAADRPQAFQGLGLDAGELNMGLSPRLVLLPERHVRHLELGEPPFVLALLT